MNSGSSFLSVNQIKALVALCRPRDWFKNVFVLAPLVFAGAFNDFSAVSAAVGAVILFCVASSAVYIFNDLHDIEEDRRHPDKSRSRPLASGMVTRAQAIALLILLYATVGLGSAAMPSVGGIMAGYIALNILHTLILKRVPVVDVFVIAIGFVLRVYAGAEAISVPVSSWMFVTTLSLALYLAVIKRRQELVTQPDSGRVVLGQYSRALLDQFAMMASIGALVFYGLFVMSVRPELVMTIPVVMFGLFRYAWIVDIRRLGESPIEVVLSDAVLAAAIVLWGVLCVGILKFQL